MDYRIRAALQSVAYYAEQAAAGEMPLVNALAAIEAALGPARDVAKKEVP